MNCTVKDLCWNINGKAIIRDIELKAEESCITGIIGPNGSGKTTLLKNIYHVLKPDTGSVYIGDRNIHKLSNRESAQLMAVVSQEETGDFDFSVEDIILMGRYPYKKIFETDSKQDRDIVKRAMDQTGLAGFEERRFVTLSGGEKQRVVIARAIAQQAKMIILDEPTNHLDIGFKFQVLDILKDSGISTIAAIHDINLAAAYCDNLYILNKGRVIAHGPPEEVLTESLIYDVFGVYTDIVINSATGIPRVYFLGVKAPLM